MSYTRARSKSGSRSTSPASSISSIISDIDDADEKVSKSNISGTGRSAQAGVFLPVGRIDTFLRKGSFAKRISPGASVYMCGALDFVMQAIIAHGISNLRMGRRKRLRPQDIRAVFDRIVPFDEFSIRNMKPVFRGGGARAQIHPNLKMSMRTKRKPGKLLPAVVHDKSDDDKFDYGRYKIPSADG